ncbi:MAG: VCBS repeat-containing protein, partial [Planctomycetes bacterium]|nr:VCBS repeat-containing protein [Planctomycetota bacterium]
MATTRRAALATALVATALYGQTETVVFDLATESQNAASGERLGEVQIVSDRPVLDFDPRPENSAAAQKRDGPSPRGSECGEGDGIHGDDDREPVTDSSYLPWSAVCKIHAHFPGDPEGTFQEGTGFLIDYYHVVTAAHVVHNDDLDLLPDYVYVVPGQLDSPCIYSDGSVDYTCPFHYAESTNVRVLPGYTGKDSDAYDMALITLDRNVGIYSGWLDYGYFDDITDYLLVPMDSAGFPGDFAEGAQMVYAPGTCTFATTNFLYVTNDAYPGQSGSPIWWTQDDESLFAMGVLTECFFLFVNEGVRFNEENSGTIFSWITEDVPPTDLPDLLAYPAGSDYFSPTVVSAGETLTGQCDLRNIGTAGAEPSISIYASLDTTITTDDYYLGSQTLAYVPPFETIDVSWSLVFPSDVPGGSYYVGWIYDDADVILEFDEDNNSAALADYQLSVQSESECDELFADDLTYGAGEGPFSVAIGDLDGDGDADLAVANRYSDNVSVLLNNGDGTFAADVLYGVGDQPQSVAIGDLDGDGDADLAVANPGSDTVS